MAAQSCDIYNFSESILNRWQDLLVRRYTNGTITKKAELAIQVSTSRLGRKHEHKRDRMLRGES